MTDNIKKPASLLLKENIASFQANQSPEQRVNDYERLKKATDTIRKSPTGKSLLDWASKNDVHIAFDYQMQRHARGLYALDTVIVSPALDDALLVSTIAHELRHAWQDRKGMIPNHYHMSPDKYMVKRRLIEADAFAHEMQVCAELFEDGIPEPLTRLTSDPDIHELFGAGMDAFLETYHDNPDTLYELKAMRSAFSGWFESEACHSYDQHSLKYYQRVLPTMDAPQTEVTQKDGPKSASSFVKDNIFTGEMTKHNGIAYKNPMLLQDLFTMIDGRKYANPTEPSYLKSKSFNPNIGLSPNLSAQYIAVMDAYADWKYMPNKPSQPQHHNIITQKR